MQSYVVTPGLSERLRSLPDELPETPAGVGGIALSGGRPGLEYEHAHALSAQRARALVYRRMMRTSPIIAMARRYLTSLITSATLVVRRQDGTSEEAADALEVWLGVGEYADSGGRIGASVDRLLSSMASAIWYGSSAHSESWEFDAEAGLYFARLHRRQQASVDRYIIDDSERLVAIVQVPLGVTGTDHRPPVLPIGETLWLVLDEEEGSHDGVSLLRSCWGNWRSEQRRYLQEDIAAHRYAVGTYRASLDEAAFLAAHRESAGLDAAPNEADLLDAAVAEMETHLKALDSYRAGHFVAPSWWTVDVLPGDYDPAPLLASVDHHQRVMAESLYVAWMSQGRAGTGGSRSMVETQADTPMRAAFEWTQWLVRALNRQTVTRFQQANFSKMDPSEYAWLGFEGITVPAWAESPGVFAEFIGAGVLTPGAEDERAVRAQLGLPVVPIDEQPSRFDRLAARAGGRLRTAGGQRAAARPGDSSPAVNKLVERAGGGAKG